MFQAVLVEALPAIPRTGQLVFQLQAGDKEGLGSDLGEPKGEFP